MAKEPQGKESSESRDDRSISRRETGASPTRPDVPSPMSFMRLCRAPLVQAERARLAACGCGVDGERALACEPVQIARAALGAVPARPG